jgi:hypothetical protein
MRPSGGECEGGELLPVPLEEFLAGPTGADMSISKLNPVRAHRVRQSHQEGGRMADLTQRARVTVKTGERLGAPRVACRVFSLIS